MRTEVADAAVLATIQREALTPEVVEAALDIALDELQRAELEPGLGVAARREALKGELVRLEGELAKYAEAIADVGPMDSLLQAMAVREVRRQAIRAELKTLAPPKAARQADPAALRTALRTRLKNWQALASRGVAEARQVLRELLEERLL